MIPLPPSCFPALLSTALTGALLCQTDWQQHGSFQTQPAGRVLCGLAYDSHRNVTILFGGRLFGGFYTNETWRHDGNDWLPLSPSTSPSGRATNILVYDRARQRVVLFGGENSFGFQDETWEWDGGNWLLRNPLHRPTARNGGAYAYDPIRRRTVVHGGWNGTRLGDTWEWDGNDWTQGASGPAPRSDHLMAYDEGRTRIVLYGGYNDVSLFLGDTWEYNGASWTVVVTNGSPGPLADPGFVYDRGRGRVVLFGGNPSFALPRTNQTWQFDGTTWTNLTSQLAHAPSGRWVAQMAYDEARGRVVLFGGIDNFNQFPNDTWYLTTPNTPIHRTFGSGCTGSQGSPQLLVDHNAMPRLGTVWGLRVQNLPTAANTLATLALGLSNTLSAGGPLPMSLAAAGMPGCFLLTSAEATSLAPAVGGAAIFGLLIPGSTAFLGLELFAQGGVFDLSANAAGIALTEGAAARIGQ